jgi:REP element-mobilizing transposase RayT
VERNVKFVEGEFYHVFNRGVDKRKIFFSAGDWNHFLKLLYIRNSNDRHIRIDRIKNKKFSDIKRGEAIVDICAYAMMNNHFHLLLKEKRKGGITQFMLQFMTSYSMYMNKKYDRTGPLICKPFRAEYIDSDQYFRWLISYIHLNPLDQFEQNWEEDGIADKSGAANFLEEYKYSSYQDYFVGERDESLILNKKILPVKIADLEDLSQMLANVLG